MAQERYYLDRDDVVTIEGQKYYKIKLTEKYGSIFPKDCVCALISTNLSNIRLDQVNFWPSKDNIKEVPIIKGGTRAHLNMKDCNFEGSVVVDLGADSGLSFQNVNAKGKVSIEATMVGTSQIEDCSIAGENIFITNSDISGYSLQGTNIMLDQQNLVGSKHSLNAIMGSNISLTSQNNDINIIENTNIKGDNIVVRGPSTIVGAELLDGTLVDNSEIVCENGQISFNKASIVEGSRIVSFGDSVTVEDSTIKNSDITIGKHQNEAKLKNKIFAILKSVVSECKGDMPQYTQDSILERCDNICQYKKVVNCEIFDESYMKPLFSNILESFGKAIKFYYEEEDSKRISHNLYEDRDVYHPISPRKQSPIEQEDKKSNDVDDLVL